MPRIEVEPGTELYYTDAGTGRPVVLVHGGFMSHRLWDPQITALADEARVLADEHLGATDFFARVRAPITGVDGDDADAGDTDRRRTGEEGRTRVRVPRSPIVSSAFDHVTATDPPGLGEDTRTVLESVGYSEADIEQFEREGVI